MIRPYVTFSLLFFISHVSAAVDWNSVKGQDVVLFHTGQASWEWSLTQSKHSGNKKFRGGKNCLDCHDTEQAEIGALIASGEKLEPSVVKGADGSTSVNVKMIRDDANLHVRFKWNVSTAPQREPMDPDHEAMITMMIGDAKVKAFVRGGCWSTCHADLPDMPSASESTKELTKYLAASRVKTTKTGGGNNFKTDAELKNLVSDGQYLEYWQARLNRGSPPKPVDGYILDKRHANKSPIVSAEAEFKDGTWVVVLSRKLQAGKPQYKDLVTDKMYTVGFALHSGHTEGRFHHVSLEYTLSLDGGDANFVVSK